MWDGGEKPLEKVWESGIMASGCEAEEKALFQGRTMLFLAGLPHRLIQDCLRSAAVVEGAAAGGDGRCVMMRQGRDEEPERAAEARNVPDAGWQSAPDADGRSVPDVDGRNALERYLKRGIYKELHARGLLPDEALAGLLDSVDGEARRAGSREGWDGRE